MAFCLKQSVFTLYHPANILLQSMLINFDVLLVPNLLDPLAVCRIWRSHLTTLRTLRRVVNE
jgi:hypothetical protein